MVGSSRMNFLDKITAQLPFGKKPESTEYYFALNIGLSEVTSAVWVVYGNQLDILGQGTSPYSGTEDLVEKAHLVLDRSLGALEIEPSKVLFGVPDAWGIDDNLKEPYIKLLKRMLKEYDLSPMAYVTTVNALAHFIQKQEGVPTTAILLGIGEFLEVTLIRGGKVIETRSTKRSDQLFDDIEKTLKQFADVEVLPSKILLYSTKPQENLSKVKDSLMSYPWMQRLAFLHFPKIDLLDEEVLIKAIAFAGAIELNPQIDLKHSFVSGKQVIVEGLAAHGRVLEEEKVDSKVSEAPIEDEGKMEDVGFVKGDIKQQEEIIEEEDLESDNLVSPENLEEVEDFGPIAGTGPKLTRLSSRRTAIEEDEMPAYVQNAVATVGNWEGQVEQEMEENLGALAKFLNKIKRKLNLPKIKGLPKLPNLIGGKILLIPAVLIALGAAYIFLVKASVTIFVDPRVLEKETQVIADPGVSKIDEEKQIIPGSTVETTVTGKGTAPATGSKQIGDPAKGKVYLYNKTDKAVSFSQGATLAGENGLKFTLDASVQIASQSSSVGADETTVITPGKSDAVGVTAVSIGPDGNLPAGTDLSVGGYSKSQVVAKVTEALSGGTSKTVTVVSAEDQKKLQAKVLDDLRQKAESELQGKMTDGKKVISEGLSVVDGKYSFNKQVNDQAGEFSLNATVRFKGTGYTEADLRTIVSKLVGTTVPDGYELDLASSETQADVVKVEKDGKLIFKAKFKAKLLPKFNLEDLKNQIKGQSVTDVASKLKSLENVMGSEIKFTPSIPTALARMPFLPNNITIIVSPK